MSPTTPRWKIVRELLLSAAVLGVSFVGLELVARSERVYGSLPLPRIHYSFEVTSRLHTFERLQQTKGDVDVLFVGSSSVRSGIDPTSFDKEVARQGGGKVLSFNAGMPSMFPSGVRVYMQNVWPKRTKPRYVLHGIRPDEIIDAHVVPDYMMRGGVIEPMWLEPSPRNTIEAALLERSRLLQYRGTVLRSLQRIRDGKRLDAPEGGNQPTDSRGFRKERTTLDDARDRDATTLWVWRRSFTDEEYALGLAELSKIKAACERMGSQYVIVHMPEHPKRFRRKEGEVIWQQYWRLLRAWATANHVPLIDTSDGDYEHFVGKENFADYHHLRPEGAKLMTKLLAERFAQLTARR